YSRPMTPVFAGQVWVRVGGVDETPGKTGLSHMLEHMAFKGTETIGTKDYRREQELLTRLDQLVQDEPAGSVIFQSQEVQDIRSELRSLWDTGEFTRLFQGQGASDLNAGTSKDYTVYTVSLPKPAFEFWAYMESERVLHPVFREFYAERDVVIEERRLRTEDDPSGKLYEALLATAYWAHPNRLPVIGWRDDVSRLTAPMARELHQTYYRPDNMVLALVGDLTEDEVRPVLERYFGRIPARPDEPLPSTRLVGEPEQEGPREVVVDMPVRPRFFIAYHKPVYPNFDDAVFTVLHELIANNRSSDFYRTFIEGRQLAASIYTTETPGERYPSLFLVGGAPRETVPTPKLIQAVQERFARLAKQGFSEEAIAEAKRRIRVSYLDSLDSNGGLASTLGRVELLHDDWHMLIDFYQDVLRVTNDDLKRVLSTYVIPRNRTVVRIAEKG
ncbi:MAG: insulinase family protein, partial [Bdellovibrionales bacterium]|nr:insulinase family protein [Bdellovibrionales bacterium]